MLIGLNKKQIGQLSNILGLVKSDRVPVTCAPADMARSLFRISLRSVRLWLVFAILGCLFVELTLLGVLPNILPSSPSSWLHGLNDPENEYDQDATRSGSPNYRHKGPYTPGRNTQHGHQEKGLNKPSNSHNRPSLPRNLSPSNRKLPGKVKPHPEFRTIVYPRSPGSIPKKHDHSLEYLMKGATLRRPNGEIYMDNRIGKMLPRWGWDTRCMPGFGRSAISIPSVDFYNFSSSANYSQLHDSVQRYSYSKTLYSHRTGEHLLIGFDVGLSLWSVVPIIKEDGSMTHISFIATPPVNPRDRPLLNDLKQQQRSVLSSPLSSSRPSSIKLRSDRSDWLDSNFRCILYTNSEVISIKATKAIDADQQLVVLSCDLSKVDTRVVSKLVTEPSEVTLALHDQELNLYWNFSQPCFPLSLKSSTDEADLKTLTTTKSSWNEVSTPIKRELTAVLIVRNETICFLQEWLTNMENLGFDHIYIYKQQMVIYSESSLDKLLMQYVKKGFVTIVPFFDVQPHCDTFQYFSTYKCESFTVGYKTLFQDAIMRFPSTWTLLLDANEMLLIPQTSTIFSNQSSKAEPPQNIKALILKTLNRSLKSTGANNGTLSLTSYPFGTGPKSVPWRSCPAERRSAMETMQWRGEYPKWGQRMFVKAGPQFVLSKPIGRVDSFDLRIHKYHIQYQGALLEHNQVFDNSTNAWALHLKSIGF